MFNRTFLVIGNIFDSFAPLFIKTVVAMLVAVGFAQFFYNENRLAIQLGYIVTCGVFWVGVFWSTDLTAKVAIEKLSHPFSLISFENNLHPLMEVGHYYRVISYVNPWGETGNRIYVLRDLQNNDDPAIFCAYTVHDFVLPAIDFRVVKKTEDRGDGSPKTSFVFE